MNHEYELGGLEQFGREQPPATCVYSPDYAPLVRRNAEQALPAIKDIPRLYNAFTYQDEPFHGGPKSFGYNAEVKAEFKKRYGYDLSDDLDSIRSDHDSDSLGNTCQPGGGTGKQQPLLRVTGRQIVADGRLKCRRTRLDSAFPPTVPGPVDRRA